ncbi:MAG: glycosyltransferase family 4 protein [Chloroflexota bacterium]|nr:glycosyltransferase family 4 protein [Chloroflexota bacterium]
MRIGILGSIAWRIPPRHYGGWESVAHLLAEGLVGRGHEVTLFATADSETRARLVSVAPRALEEDRSLPSRAYETLHIANAFEHARELDVLHNHTGVYATALSRLVSTRVVTTLHGSAAESDSRLIYTRYREQPYVSITDAERQLAPELNYVATVYNGIQVADTPPSVQPEDYLLVVGRLSPDKGIHLAVEVAQLIGRRLVIAGIVPDSNREYFETQVRPHLDGERISFFGPCTTEQRTELMSHAYAFLHLITYHEAFGLTMVEAMAAGAPVIAFPKGSVPELVRDGETGFIVDTVQAAAEALDRVPSLDRVRSWEWTRQRFSAEQMVDGYEQVYARVLAR